MPKLLAALFCVFAAAAAEPSPFDQRITVEVRHAPLPTFLDTLSAQGKVNFILTEGFEDEKVTAFLHDVKLSEALDVIRELKDVDYLQVGHSSTYIVARRGSPALVKPEFMDGGPEFDRKVSVALRQAPLDRFLDTLSRQAKINFAVDESVGERKVTAFLKDVTVRDALQAVMAVKGLSCRKLGGKQVYEIGSSSKSRYKVGETFRKSAP